jgi:hypothetical protein
MARDVQQLLNDYEQYRLETEDPLDYDDWFETQVESKTYEIVRIWKDSGKRETIKTGLTRDEAREHCSDPDSEGEDAEGKWMDCFYEE